jgi:hypothetical protein
MENIQKRGQRDLTGEDGSLADAGGADEEDTGPRLQGSLHGLAPKPCTLTLDQKVSGFDFVDAEWEVRRRDARVNDQRERGGRQTKKAVTQILRFHSGMAYFFFTPVPPSRDSRARD